MAGTSLVVRSMGIGLPMQGTWVRSWSRMILHAGATKPRYCNYWAQSPNDWRLCTYSWCSPWQWECHGPQLQRARGQQRRSSTTKNKIKKKKKNHHHWKHWRMSSSKHPVTLLLNSWDGSVLLRESNKNSLEPSLRYIYKNTKFENFIRNNYTHWPLRKKTRFSSQNWW